MLCSTPVLLRSMGPGARAIALAQTTPLLSYFAFSANALVNVFDRSICAFFTSAED